MNPLHKQPPLILVVDHQQHVLDEVAAALAKAGFACQCCTTAEEAIEKAKTTTFDLIISDINLHGHSGLQMCEEIKRHEASADVPVMFLSAAQIPDIIRRSDPVGGAYYLRKPFDPDVLIELIDKALWTPHLVSAHGRPKEIVVATN